MRPVPRATVRRCATIAERLIPAAGQRGQGHETLVSAVKRRAIRFAEAAAAARFWQRSVAGAEALGRECLDRDAGGRGAGYRTSVLAVPARGGGCRALRLVPWVYSPPRRVRDDAA